MGGGGEGVRGRVWPRRRLWQHTVAGYRDGGTVAEPTCPGSSPPGVSASGATGSGGDGCGSGCGGCGGGGGGGVDDDWRGRRGGSGHRPPPYSISSVPLSRDGLTACDARRRHPTRRPRSPRARCPLAATDWGRSGVGADRGGDTIAGQEAPPVIASSGREWGDTAGHVHTVVRVYLLSRMPDGARLTNSDCGGMTAPSPLFASRKGTGSQAATGSQTHCGWEVVMYTLSLQTADPAGLCPFCPSRATSA